MVTTTLCVVQNYEFMGAQESPLLTLDELAAHARELKMGCELCLPSQPFALPWRRSLNSAIIEPLLFPDREIIGWFMPPQSKHSRSGNITCV
jgi:hypothetical protein